MGRLFISYTRANSKSASALSTCFKACGYDVFYDVELIAGDAWDTRLEAELDRADIVVVLWSTASRERAFVRNEARYALNRGILVPARLDDCAIPLEFSHVQCADLRNWTGSHDAAFQALLTAVQNTVAAPVAQKKPTADNQNLQGDPKEPGLGFGVRLREFLKPRQTQRPGDPPDLTIDISQRDAKLRAHSFGFNPRLTDLYMQAIAHAQSMNAFAHPEASDQDIAQLARTAEIQGIEATFRARHAALRKNSVNSFRRLALACPHPSKPSLPPLSGTFYGTVSKNCANGWGVFKADDFDDMPNYPTGSTWTMAGLWEDSLLTGHAIILEDWIYEGGTREATEAYLGQVDQGQQRGYGSIGTEFRHGARFFSSVKTGVFDRARDTSLCVAYKPDDWTYDNAGRYDPTEAFWRTEGDKHAGHRREISFFSEEWTTPKAKLARNDALFIEIDWPTTSTL